MAVKIKNNSLKSFLCIIICTALVLCSVVKGEGAVIYLNSLMQGKTTNNNSVEYFENAEKTGNINEIYNITGYGGGGYINASASITPADIETLKEQAKLLYKNYTKAGSIKETHMGATSKTITCGVVEVDNKTNVQIDLKKLLGQKGEYGTITKDKPYILIYHTHTTEGYEMLDLGWYAKEYNSRTKDLQKNMVRVGDELANTLTQAGYNVIHDRSIYDSSYNGAYSRSRVSVEKYLEKYPSIVMTLDVHRDAIQYSDGTKCKPTAQVNGKKAAQVMIISGCEGNGIEDFPQWEKNLAFALDLQSRAEEMYPDLMRPVFFCHRKYNMDVTPCSLLLEFGTDANTLEEAVYSAQLIGTALADVLNKNME